MDITFQSNTTAPSENRRLLQGWTLASVLVSLMLANFLAGLDQVIVDTALPHIIGDLQGFDRYTWVLTAYLLASTAMIPVVGKLSDQFGRKWLLMTAIGAFLLSSALSGASQTMNQLIIFRGLQGLSAGTMQVLVSTLVADIFLPVERARWQGMTTGIYALASVIGPAAGGWITDHLGWRWIFYINLPLAPFALVALFFWLPASISVRSTEARGWAAIRRIDFLGALSMASATICLLLGLTWGGQTYPWNSPQVITILCAAGALFLAFVVAEVFAVHSAQSGLCGGRAAQSRDEYGAACYAGLYPAFYSGRAGAICYQFWRGGHAPDSDNYVQRHPERAAGEQERALSVGCLVGNDDLRRGGRVDGAGQSFYQPGDHHAQYARAWPGRGHGAASADDCRPERDPAHPAWRGHGRDDLFTLAWINAGRGSDRDSGKQWRCR